MFLSNKHILVEVRCILKSKLDIDKMAQISKQQNMY